MWWAYKPTSKSFRESVERAAEIRGPFALPGNGGDGHRQFDHDDISLAEYTADSHNPAMMAYSKKHLPVLVFLALALTACAGAKIEPVTEEPLTAEEQRDRSGGKLLGDDALTLSAGRFRNRDENSGGGGGIGVNSYLWRASLDTLAFMPLSSADPFGGVIISDWYSPPESPNERFKVTVFILDTELRSDGLRASVFRQQRTDQSAEWTDAAVDDTTPPRLEEAILTRARELRISNTS